MTEFFTKAGIDAFFDKFQDPSLKVNTIAAALWWFDTEGVQHMTTDRVETLRLYFVERLIMKSYRYGKEHGYEGAMRAIRERGGR